VNATVSSHPHFVTAIDWGAGARRCAVGRGGIAFKNREGDGITPIGLWPVRRVLYRADRIARPATALPLTAIVPDDGWCDAPDDSAYNTQIQLPFSASAERLWRDDALYDLVAVLGFNDDPVVAGKGSAIFVHVARPDFAPTEGCVALALPDLLAMLSAMTKGDAVRIQA
jgi:L,D-peptidoglycan transpeptidase YkuD (ErfK/YbiS/YcfS/YnhG family)